MTHQPVAPSSGRWFRPPRHVLTLFLGVTGMLSLAMRWLAWQLIAKDRALAAQRAQERLENAAETVADGPLASVASRPPRYHSSI